MKPLADVTVALDKQEDGRILLSLTAGNAFGRYYDFQVPFTRTEIEQALEDVSPNRVAVDPLVSFGSTLFSALFSGDRGRALWGQLDEATRENSALRLRIKTNVETLQHLPWELLYDASRGDFISLSGRVAVVRTRPDAFRRFEPAPTPSQKLRILAASADPNGQLRVEDDFKVFGDLITAQGDRLEIFHIPRATIAALTNALKGSTFDVFVFFGKGVVLEDVSRRGGVLQALQLVPEDSSDLGQLKRNQLGDWLAEAGVRLALLDGSDTEWIARSLAKHVPASIGFRGTIQRRSRSVVAESLFEALLADLPLDLAVTRVRQAVDRAEPGNGDWCRLIFYMQPTDGDFLLVSRPPAEASRHEPPAHWNREVVKLMRLRDVHLANLAELQRTGLSRRDEVIRREVEALREEIAALAQRIDAAEHARGTES